MNTCVLVIALGDQALSATTQPRPWMARGRNASMRHFGKPLSGHTQLETEELHDLGS